MPRKEALKTSSNAEQAVPESGGESPDEFEGGGSDRQSGNPSKTKKNGSWREIEARREKAALKASLADVWDEDFDLDEETLAELDHTAEYFTQQEEDEEEVFVDDDDADADEFYDDEEV